MYDFSLNIDPYSNTLKYLQLADRITDAISKGVLNEGDMLPSVNELVKEAELSRDTVFKALTELKNRGVIESVPNKGYFVTRQFNKVFLFLDTFKAYKEVLYDGFRSNLPSNISVDLHFHHYNINILESIIDDSIGKYSHYIIMNFDHPQMARIINKIPKEKLLIIDWNIHAQKEHSYVCQDFGKALYDNLLLHKKRIQKYDRFVYIYPKSWTYHPITSIDYFKKFCSQNDISNEIYYSMNDVVLKKGDLFLLVSDQTLAKIIDISQEMDFQLGCDIGILSYNETPMKKYVKNGISVISTDFTTMGKLAAEFVNTPHPMKEVVPTKIEIRNSF